MLNKIKDNLSLIFTVLLICIVFWFGKSCGSKIASETDFKPNTDTLIITKVDTIFAKDTILKYALKLKFKHDTTIKPIYIDSTACNRIYVYEDTINTKEYTLFRKSHVQGILRFDTTGIKLKVPLEITKTTTLTIKHDTIVPSKYEVHIGLLTSPKMLAPKIDLSINKNTFSVGYDPFNKTPIIGYSYRIWRSKK